MSAWCPSCGSIVEPFVGEFSFWYRPGGGMMYNIVAGVTEFQDSLGNRFAARVIETARGNLSDHVGYGKTMEDAVKNLREKVNKE